MADIPTLEDLQNADVDMSTLASFANDVAGIVTPREGSPYPNIRQLVANASFAVDGLTSYDTVADLPTPIPANGSRAYVYDDPTSTNNGVWIVKSNAWGFDQDYYNAILSSINNLVDRLKTDVFYLQPIGSVAIRDRSGILGGGANVLYMPKQVWYQRAGGSQDTAVANSDSGNLPNYCKLTLSSNGIGYVYYSLADNTYYAENYSSGLNFHTDLGANLIMIGVFLGDQINLRCDHVEADDYINQTQIEMTRQLVQEDGGKLLVSDYYVRGGENAVNLRRSPVPTATATYNSTLTAERYCEVAINTGSGSTSHHYHDEIIAGGAVVTASITPGSGSTGTMTVTALANATATPVSVVRVGQTFNAGNGLTTITASGTGIGGAGTYTVDLSQTVASTSITLAPAPGSFIKTVNDTAAGAAPGWRRTTIARSCNSIVSSPFAMARTVPNQCAYGKNTDAMPLLSGCSPVAITDAALIALGFTRGLANAAANVNIYGGFPVPDGRAGGSAFIRVYVQTDTANTFGLAQCVFWSASGVLTSVQLQLEKVLSTTAAIFSIKVNIPTTWAPIDHVFIGVNGAAGVKQAITGFQFHHSGLAADWIMRADYPTALPDGVRIANLESATTIPSGTNLEPLIGDELFVTSDRPLPLFPLNMFGYRGDANIAFSRLETDLLPPAVLPVPTESAREALLINAADYTSAATLKVRPVGNAMTRYTKALTVLKKTVPVTGSPALKLFGYGDSITRRGTLANIGLTLTGWGYSPTFIGTLEGEAATSTSYTGPLGEGREGWATTDSLLTRQDSDVTAVLTDGGEAAYLAAGQATRQATNPFMNLAANSGSAAPTITWQGQNYKFDLVHYQARFGLASPDIVLLNLGKNDQLEQNAATALSDVTTGYDQIIAEMRRAWPSAKIICWATTMPFDGSTTWQTAWYPLIKAIYGIIRTRRAAGDVNLHLCSTWAHQSPENFQLNTGTVDPATGLTVTSYADNIHPTDLSRYQHCEALAAAVACVA